MDTHLTIWIAFGAGVLSFLSPCTLPLFPSYLGYISGVSFRDLSMLSGTRAASVRWKAFAHALCFCLGLSVLFILLGWSFTSVGRVLVEYKSSVRYIGGLIVILMGLFMAGVLRADWLMRERRFQMPAVKPLGYLGSVLVGVVFAAGWTPCIGPILAAVLTMAFANPSVGDLYMVAYAIGFSVPFLVFAITLVSLRPLFKYTEVVSKIGGWLMVLMGLLLVFDKMSLITRWLQQTTGFSGF